MANQDIRSDSSKLSISLVLSIFKAENFVVKGSGYRAFLRAKCADLQPDLALESGKTLLSSSCSEPEFNSQLAWSLSRKQLKELRSNRSTIKVSCMIVDERTGRENEVGYVIMHIKDAAALPKDVNADVDPSKAGHHNNNNVKSNNFSELSSGEPVKIEQEERVEVPLLPIANASKLAETKVQQNKEPSDKFVWTVHESEGYFQLGYPADQDDLYIFNTTVISASYLHKLWDGKSSPRKHNKEEYFWQIKYTAYGCEVASDPFMLDTQDTSRRTFIGDKATARIRASGRMFYEYLLENCLEFHVLRYQISGNGNKLINEEVMGFCYVTLGDLSGPDKKEHKVCMNIVSEWGTSKAVSAHEKPEVRVLFTVEAVPNYFSLCNSHSQAYGNNIVAPQEVHGSEVNHTPVNTNNRSFINEPDLRADHNDKETRTTAPQLPVVVREEEAEDVPVARNSSTVRRLLQFEGEENEDPDHNVSPGTSVSNNPPSRKNATDEFLENEDTDSSDLANNNDKEISESLAKLMPKPGQYNVIIELTRFWLKSSRVLEDTFVLSYSHRPIGIEEPMDFYAQRFEAGVTESYQGFVLLNKEFSKTVTIQKYSEKLINQPLTIEFCKLIEGEKARRFATAMIPFGQIFTEPPHESLRSFSDSVDILKMNNVKIGSLSFEIKLKQCSKIPSPAIDCAGTGTPTKQKQSAFFPTRVSNGHEVQHSRKSPSSDKYFRDVEQMDRVTNEMRKWTKTQEEIFRKQKEEKETAYLKILSEEAAKRDAERETVMSKKLTDVKKKGKELNRQRRQLDEKEDKLKQLEAEYKDKLRELKLEQETIQHTTEIYKRRLQEDCQIQLDSLHRQIQSYKDDNEKLKTKYVILEKKLEKKDADIDKLIDLKREQPDPQFKLLSMEQENQLLRKQLQDCEKRKEQYKKQMLVVCEKNQDLHAEKDQELRNLTENLRLQILASKEHKEIKRERRTVHEITETIKALQKEKVPSAVPVPATGNGDHADYPRSGSAKDKEIIRLQQERNQLLATGAYTQFDLVIKELEKKMIMLSSQ